MSKFRIKRTDLSCPRFRRRRLYARKRQFELTGGPICLAWLTTPGTLVFRLGDWFGYYDGNNNWVQL